MRSSVIVEGDSPITLVNVFTVEPDHQDRLIAVLTTATEEVMKHLDGFISANIHASTDGTRVVNYAQWRDTAAYEAMFTDAGAAEHMREAAAMAQSYDPHLYVVRAIHQSSTQ